jgi:hypothetical protein
MNRLTEIDVIAGRYRPSADPSAMDVEQLM